MTAQQSVTIQALAMEITSAGKQSQQELLNTINANIASKKAEIANQESLIASIEENLDAENPESYAGQIQAIVDELSIDNYFTEDEYNRLSKYFIEQNMTEDTFIASHS